MSRTDKTDPMWVRMQDPANQDEVRTVHNHEHGICDLDTWDPRGGYWRRKGQHCYKTPWPYKKLLCNCSTCTGRAWNNWQGSSRAEWRAQRQAWLSGWGEHRKERCARKYWYD